jgi:hypothetical protein
MSADLETAWQAIGVTWRTDEHRVTTSAEHLAQRVRRQSDRLRLIVVGEIALTVAMLVASGAVIVRNAGASAVRVGLMVVLYTAAVWAFTLWNRRGVWSPYGETTADFVGLLRVRAQRRIRSAWFSQIVISVAVILVAREIEAAWRAGEITVVDWVWIALGAYSLAVILWSTWYRLQAQREIRQLDALAQDLVQREEGSRVAE